jgi:putative nucleotidyltransferase with HDIG domain
MNSALTTLDLVDLANNISDVVCSFCINPKFGIAFINRAILHMSLYTQEEFYEDPELIFRIVHADDRHIFKSMLKEGHPPQSEFRMCRRNGVIFRVQGNFNDVYHASHELTAVHAVLRLIPDDDEVNTTSKTITVDIDQRMQRYIEELKIISDIGRTLGESLDLAEIFKRLGTAVHRMFPDVHAQYISKYHPEDDNITCEYAVINGDELDISELSPVPLDYSPQATQSKAIIQREPYIISDMVAHRGGAHKMGQLIGSGQIPHSALYVPMLSKNNVLGVIQVQSTELNRFNDEDARLLAVVANAAATVMQNAQIHLELMDSYNQTLEGWGQAVDLRDKETEGHSLRVADLARRMATRLGINGDTLTDIWRGALLHDIGKLGVPDAVLFKPGAFTPEEWEEMRKHPQLALDMLKSISFLKGALDIPYGHHECWDGSGYPRGLQGENIPLAARIFAFVDVWDAVTSDRPYRPAWSKEKALEYIHSRLGIQLDPSLESIFLDVIREVNG